jgi:hypothetical protein
MKGKSTEGNFVFMRREMVLAALALAGCGGYFDQHPANVRPETEAVASVLARQQPQAAGQSGYATPSPAPPAEVAQTIAPPPSTARPPAAAPGPQPTEETIAIRREPAPRTGETGVVSANLPPAIATKPPVANAQQPSTTVAAPAAAAQTANTARPAQQQVFIPEAVAPAAAASAPIVETTPPPAVMSTSPVISVQGAAPNGSPPEEMAAPTQRQSAPSQPPSPTAPPPAVAMQSVPEMPVAAAAAPPLATPDTHCESVAKQRAEDAGASGLDRETQEIVRRGAYADCLAWDEAHPGSH